MAKIAGLNDVLSSKQHQFTFVGRLPGPRDNSLNRTEASTGCRVFIRGQGSIKDPDKDLCIAKKRLKDEQRRDGQDCARQLFDEMVLRFLIVFPGGKMVPSEMVNDVIFGDTSYIGGDSKYNIADGMRQMFDPFERVARAHHIFPCCKRPFSAEEEDDFVKKQRIKAASSADRMRSLAVSEEKSNFQQPEELHLMYEEYNKICKETIPLAERKLVELKVDLEQRTEALDNVLGVLSQISSDKELVESLMQPVETCATLLDEIRKLHDFRVNNK